MELLLIGAVRAERAIVLRAIIKYSERRSNDATCLPMQSLAGSLTPLI